MLDLGAVAATVSIVDGRLADVALDPAIASLGVSVAVATDSEEVALLAYPEPDGLTDLHDAFVADVVVVDVPAGVAVEQPILVAVSASEVGAATFPHLVVRTGESGEATVVVQSVSPDGNVLVVPVVELHLAPASNLRYLDLQTLGSDAWQASHVLATIGRDATLRAWVAAAGGEYARTYVAVSLPGQGASAKVSGVYFGDRGQVLDFRSLQDHIGTRSVSDFQLKGAVVDEAHGIYTGLIRVREGAKATESFLGNRNLVLAEGAHVDSVPNLEITNENDIRSCGHAAATGPVDEEHVFYLESRGVPTVAAERLIVNGFFEDVLGDVPIPAVAAAVRAAFARKLEKVGAHG